MLGTSLWDYSDTYILVSGTITITGAWNDDPVRLLDERNKRVIIENCAPFTDWISEINNNLDSSLEIISVVKPDTNIFLWTAADAAAVNPNGIKTLLANGLSTFPIKINQVFNDGFKSLPENPPDFTILCNWVFDNFI